MQMWYLKPQKAIIGKKAITCSLLSQYEQHGITLVLHEMQEIPVAFRA